MYAYKPLEPPFFYDVSACHNYTYVAYLFGSFARKCSCHLSSSPLTPPSELKIFDSLGTLSLRIRLCIFMSRNKFRKFNFCYFSPCVL